MSTCVLTSLLSTRQEPSKSVGTVLQGDSGSELQVQQQLACWGKGDFGCPLYSRLVVLENGERINLQQYIYYLRLAVYLVLRKGLNSATNFRANLPEKIMPHVINITKLNSTYFSIVDAFLSSRQHTVCWSKSILFLCIRRLQFTNECEATNW